MSSVASCRQCGCSEIDTDPCRGDAVCTACGFVLEESLIVSEVTFEEDGHGGASAVGQFVSADSRGGGLSSSLTGFHSGVPKESREITLRLAKKRIVDVAQQLRLNQHCIDVAFNFFKMALHKQLTKGRRHPLTIAACVYMTCRMEGTPHLLIDFSDVVQMDVYSLGRTFLLISRALFINIPSVDPCLYVLRFSHKFSLGPKTHEVSMTALRLLQRMKRDWIHTGRRPSGLCGAALLIAARLHGFSRTVADVIQVVKVHETTLRRRLIEFGETPSSSLTLDEFMSVDLEEEHDPPAYKAARVRDREHLQKLMESGVSEEIISLRNKIDAELWKRKSRFEMDSKSPDCLSISSSPFSSTENIFLASSPDDETAPYVLASSLSTISQLLDSKSPPHNSQLIDHLTPTSLENQIQTLLNPTPNTNLTSSTIVQQYDKCSTNKSDQRGGKMDKYKSIEMSSSNRTVIVVKSEVDKELDKLLMPPPPPGVSKEEVDFEEEEEEGRRRSEEGELDLDGIDDEEIDGYIMNKTEAERKRILWENLNNDYIVAQEKKKTQMEQDIKDGKFDKKKKMKKEKGAGKDAKFHARNANEAIKIMLENKLSSKINYDVLKALTKPGDISALMPDLSPSDKDKSDGEFVTVIESGPVIPKRNGEESEKRSRKRFNSDSDSIETLKSSSSVSVVIDPNTKSIILKPHCVKSESGEIGTSSTNKRTKLESKDEYKNIEEEEEEEDNLNEEEEEEEEPEVITIPDPVVESGPVHYDDETHEEEYQDEIYDEDEEEEEELVSASELLNKFRGESDVNVDNYYD